MLDSSSAFRVLGYELLPLIVIKLQPGCLAVEAFNDQEVRISERVSKGFRVLIFRTVIGRHSGVVILVFDNHVTITVQAFLALASAATNNKFCHEQ